MDKLKFIIITAAISQAAFAAGGYEPEPGTTQATTHPHQDILDRAQQSIDRAEANEKKRKNKNINHKKESVDYASARTDKACVEFGNEVRKGVSTNWQQEIKRRGLYQHKFIFSIKDRTFGIGANTCTVLAALGMPTDINRSVYSFGTHTQMVYGQVYVYTENDIVTSWQD